MIIREYHLPLTYVLWAFALSYTCWITMESAFFRLGRKAKNEESQSQAELNGNMLLLETPDTMIEEQGNQAGTRTWNSAHKFTAVEAIGPKEKPATVKLNQLDVK